MQKWRVEFSGWVDVETENLSEAEALRAAFAKLQADGPANHLFADVDPIFPTDAATQEYITSSTKAEKI